MRYYSAMFYIHWDRVSHSIGGHFEKYSEPVWVWKVISLISELWPRAPPPPLASTDSN